MGKNVLCVAARSTMNGSLVSEEKKESAVCLLPQKFIAYAMWPGKLSFASHYLEKKKGVIISCVNKRAFMLNVFKKKTLSIRLGS